MRCRWLVCAALLAGMAGCGSKGGDSAVPPPGGGQAVAPSSGAADSVSGQSATDTSWDLLDDTVLKVSVVPPLGDNTTLLVTRRYHTEVHAPLKSLSYRVVTDSAPDAEWVALPEPTKIDLGEGMFDSNYETAVALPTGNVGIQFKVDQGFGDPRELKDWTIQVK